jgi:hypothetical protein
MGSEHHDICQLAVQATVHRFCKVNPGTLIACFICSIDYAPPAQVERCCSSLIKSKRLAARKSRQATTLRYKDCLIEVMIVYTAISSLLCNSAEQSSCLFYPDTERLEAIDKSAVWLDYSTRHKDQVTWDKLRMIGTYALTYCNSLVATWHAFLRVYTSISSPLCNSAITQQSTATICMSGAEHSDCDQ